jgi:arylsulfatase A-like enzyme
MYPLQYGWSALRAVRQGRFKFIEAPRPELYDLESDPDEVRNLHDTQPATSASLLSLIQTFGRAELSGAPPGDDAARERLAALGYAGSHMNPSPPSAPAVLPDPKDMIGAYNEIVEQRLNRR